MFGWMICLGIRKRTSDARLKEGHDGKNELNNIRYVNWNIVDYRLIMSVLSFDYWSNGLRQDMMSKNIAVAKFIINIELIRILCGVKCSLLNKIETWIKWVLEHSKNLQICAFIWMSGTAGSLKLVHCSSRTVSKHDITLPSRDIRHSHTQGRLGSGTIITTTTNLFLGQQYLRYFPYHD